MQHDVSTRAISLLRLTRKRGTIIYAPRSGSRRQDGKVKDHEAMRQPDDDIRRLNLILNAMS